MFSGAGGKQTNKKSLACVYCCLQFPLTENDIDIDIATGDSQLAQSVQDEHCQLKVDNEQNDDDRFFVG